MDSTFALVLDELAQVARSIEPAEAAGDEQEPTVGALAGVAIGLSARGVAVLVSRAPGDPMELIHLRSRSSGAAVALADFDRDGFQDLATALRAPDGIAVFDDRFLGGAGAPHPGPSACGPDPTQDALECAGYAAPCA